MFQELKINSKVPFIPYFLSLANFVTLVESPADFFELDWLFHRSCQYISSDSREEGLCWPLGWLQNIHVCRISLLLNPSVLLIFSSAHFRITAHTILWRFPWGGQMREIQVSPLPAMRMIIWMIRLPAIWHDYFSELLDEEEFGKASSSVEEYDESKVNTAKELALGVRALTSATISISNAIQSLMWTLCCPRQDGDADGRMFFFQLPAALPLGRRPEATTTKGKETGGKMLGISGNRCSLDDLPAGFMGKMLVYKSGAIKMKLGDAIFDVSTPPPPLRQEAFFFLFPW